MTENNELEVKFWQCAVCGEIVEGIEPPEVCVVCGAGREAFAEYIPENNKTLIRNTALKVAIIGSGVAAVSAAKAIRARNNKAQIDIYTNENEFPYNRPLLTKGLGRDLTKMKFFIENKNFYEENNINFHFNCLVNEIIPNANSIVVSPNTSGDDLNVINDNRDTEIVKYGKLLIATGAEAFIPPFQGCDLPEVGVLRKKKDLNNLYNLLQTNANSSKKVVIIGGGLLGLETASALDRMGHQVTVIEACPTILPRQLDPEGAPILLSAITENSNVAVKYGIFVNQVHGEDHVRSVETKNGEIIDCDIVVVSAGNKANYQLAKNANLNTKQAIVVDEFMRTSNKDIYAAGDCAVFNGRIDGIWETAKDQGEVAGANICGEKITYQSKPFGATFRAFKTSLFALGDIECGEGSCAIAEVKNEPLKMYNKFFFKNNILVGGILLGNVGKTKELIKGVTEQIDVEEAKELNLI